MKLILFTFLGALGISATSQISIKTDAHSFALDELSNIYLVSSQKVEMYDPSGELLFVYNPSITNRVYSLDVNRALRPLVFYKDQGLLQYLDNTLSEHNRPVDLYSLDFGRIELVASSVDNHLWVFDSVNLELVRLDKNLTVVSRSGNLGAWIGTAADFDEMREYRDKVYLSGPSGLYVFDLFANFDHVHTPKGVDQMFMDAGLIYFKQDFGWLCTTEAGLPVEVPALPEDKKQVVLKGNRVHVLDRGLFTISAVKKD